VEMQPEAIFADNFGGWGAASTRCVSAWAYAWLTWRIGSASALVGLQLGGLR